jgi:hypothetical protein
VRRIGQRRRSVARTLWRIDGDKVMRGRKAIATISEMPSGNWRWDGMGIGRENFLMREWILEDVKWFHRYPSKRKTILTFKGGGRVAV